MDIRFEKTPKTVLEEPHDAFVNVTSAICGTDFHFIHGIIKPMKKETILSHKAISIVEA